MKTLVTLSVLALVGLASGCASGSGGSGRPAITGHPQRVAYYDFRTRLHIELVNESHTDRVEQYSEKRADASRKVQSDEVLEGLVDALEGAGFKKLSLAGGAPLGGGEGVMMAVEIEDGDELRHVLGVKGMPAKDKQSVLRMAQGIVEIYNATYSLQAVDTKPGEEVFKNPAVPSKKKPSADFGGGNGRG